MVACREIGDGPCRRDALGDQNRHLGGERLSQQFGFEHIQRTAVSWSLTGIHKANAAGQKALDFSRSERLSAT